MTNDTQSTRTGTPGSDVAAFDVDDIRSQIPQLKRTVRGRPLVYLDNAATALRPQCVLDAEMHYYTQCNANVHRGVHTLSQEATVLYEKARDSAARGLNAARREEIIFTSGTTESVNLVAQTWGQTHLSEGDEILISGMEHHSNIVPWYLVAEQTGATVRVVPMLQNGAIDYDAFESMLSERTKVLAIVHVSNALGTINPVQAMTAAAHRHGAVVLIDGAQAMPHLQVDVQDIGCDFYACSGHKMFGPTGVGLLYGRFDVLDAMPPYQGGGEMIKSVSHSGIVYNDVPHKFEAGTPNIAGVIGFGAAFDWLASIDHAGAEKHEQHLLHYALERLDAIDGIAIIGRAPEQASSISFVLESVHPHDIGTILDDEGIAIRTGHHCAQPVMEFYNIPATARASMALYNTTEEVDVLIAGLERVREVFGA